LTRQRSLCVTPSTGEMRAPTAGDHTGCHRQVRSKAGAHLRAGCRRAARSVYPAALSRSYRKKQPALAEVYNYGHMGGVGWV